MSHFLEPFFRQNGIEFSAALPYEDSLKVFPCAASRRIPAGSKTVFPLLLPYRVAAFSRRNLSLYACVRDYHQVAAEFLGGLCRELEAQYNHPFAAFSDSSPFDEVSLAHRGALGVKGENGLIINEKYGSYVFLAELVTPLPLPEYPAYHPASCPGCGACRQSCPGGALTPQGFLPQQCASFVSQKKGALTPQEQALIRRSGLVWGCDLCQESCPLNQNAALSQFPPFLKNPLERFTPQDAPRLCKEYAFGFRGPAVILRNYEILNCDSDF